MQITLKNQGLIKIEATVKKTNDTFIKVHDLQDGTFPLFLEIESLKVIYDRINLLSKVDWDRFIALAEQTKSADYLEISNLKHINNLVRKKDKNIGEINIRKAHELLIKLSTKFKIKY